MINKKTVINYVTYILFPFFVLGFFLVCIKGYLDTDYLIYLFNIVILTVIVNLFITYLLFKNVDDKVILINNFLYEMVTETQSLNDDKFMKKLLKSLDKTVKQEFKRK